MPFPRNILALTCLAAGALTIAIFPVAVGSARAQQPEAPARNLPSQEEAEDLLEAAGLVQNGSAWVSAAEERLRTLLKEHEPLERRFYKAELARWEALYAQQTVRLADEGQKQVRDVLRSRALENEQALAFKQYERFAKLVKGSPPVPRASNELKVEELRRKVLESVEARSALMVSILEIRQLTDAKILASYEPIRMNAELGVALAAMGPLARLGPLKRYDSQQKGIDKSAAEVLTDVMPMYREDGRYCITGLAADRISITFDYAPENDLSLIGEHVARDLGITLGPQTPRVTLSIGDRKLDAWRVRIPAVRFGKHVLRDIPAAVLPKQEAKTSPRLGRSAWNGFGVELETDRLEFRLISHADSGRTN